VSTAERSLTEPRSTDSKPKVKVRVGEFLHRVRMRIATGLAIVLTLFFAYHVMVGHNGVNIYKQKRIEDRELHNQIDALQQENERLKEHLDRLKSDPDAIEHEARERLHYARPGEVIYTLNDSQGVNGQQAPAAVSPGGK